MKQILIIFLLFNTALCLAQKSTNVWYFGNNVGLNFNTNPPTPLYDNKLLFEEGGSTICNNNGRLLFYTNGLTVLNKNHQLMLNGGGLQGDLSSSNNIVIAPVPDNDSLYYLFTVGAANQPTKGFRYSIINMKGDNGKGEVITKNILIEDEVYEKIIGIRHCNNKDIWIVVRKWDTDEYHSFLLTNSGLSSIPIISHTNLVIGGNSNNSIGVLKASINGKKIAAAHAYQNAIVELMDFNNSTGIITNSINFKPVPSGGGIPQFFSIPYSVEFSPNGKLLYVSNNTFIDDGENSLVQFDISSHNAATILTTKRVLTILNPLYSGGLQIASDGKIYFAQVGEQYLSSIDNPNIYGTGCGFVAKKIFLAKNNTTPIRAGLPNFIQSYFDATLNPYDFSFVQGKCTNKNLLFAIDRSGGIDSVKWNFGDNMTSTSINPSHSYVGTGIFDVVLKVFYNGCSGLSVDVSTHKVFIADNEDLLDDDIGICDTVNKKVVAKQIITDASYLWSTGEATTEILVKKTGKYYLDFNFNGCTLSDTINVFQKPKPTLNLKRDTSVCTTKPIFLTAPLIANATYRWNTGELSNQIKINTPGVYTVTVTSDCAVSDTINVIGGDCEFFMPNVFTPNADGKNDTFGPATTFGAKDYYFVVFDRWGNKVFETRDNTKKWDGKLKNANVTNGSYTWIIHYTTLKGYYTEHKGSVLLIH